MKRGLTYSAYKIKYKKHLLKEKLQYDDLTNHNSVGQTNGPRVKAEHKCIIHIINFYKTNIFCPYNLN